LRLFRRVFLVSGCKGTKKNNAKLYLSVKILRFLPNVKMTVGVMVGVMVGVVVGVTVSVLPRI
jgi:hypothetical protein